MYACMYVYIIIHMFICRFICISSISTKNMVDIIKLNVGGHIYTTTKATVSRFPCSMLGAMFNGHMSGQTDENGAYFIDRDGTVFVHILNFLRTGKLCLPTDFNQRELLIAEADFYQIEPLCQAVETYEVKQRQLTKTAKKPPEGSLLEVIEIRTGSTATMPTRNSRVKTIVSGQRQLIMNLPTDFIGATEKLQFSDFEFTEVELFGSNVRLKLAEYLRENGWSLLDSSFSSSSGYDAKSMISSLIIEHSYRDQWLLIKQEPEDEIILDFDLPDF